ncbi:HepT-like ribonuclease domain-containing protein [Hydrogenimonas thermophila]|uniref:Uncharacterized conserved protein, contains HEPN domain n=1 Tax=Hydrogenimonas thermophila TaxID=223786 RepID=A0A1I5MAM0_9BACT|nr:HepT-like ribonuclease domain-containing protein [Hydrogenimonas thermophila]WOE70628.1 HepT-like ribonuclease domain-containing protein [Hydrogenimonas thermophila]WOE73146.1 HepT-like ribonuclease domain-containing protein [Hydrogenimonas thermophila]SFP06668.1 Uncharacterized conserved protein, contains HEPN domain [Hydrogenimonas thermophila]
MYKRDISLYIVDIFIAIDKIGRYTKNFDNAQDLLYSELEWDGTLRELEIIGEATNYLLKEGYLSSDYRRIVDFRNQIIHGYFGIDENIVFDVIKNKLPKYYQDLIIIAKNTNLLKAIKSAKIENEKNQNVLKFLNDLEKEIEE